MTIKSDQTPYCECCGKETRISWPIHFLCMGKHWSKHVKGINASRCEEMKLQRIIDEQDFEDRKNEIDLANYSNSSMDLWRNRFRLGPLYGSK